MKRNYYSLLFLLSSTVAVVHCSEPKSPQEHGMPNALTDREQQIISTYRQINELGPVERAYLLFAHQHQHLIDARNREQYRYIQPPKEGECPFCEQLNARDDRKYKILRRLPNTFVMMNANPYTRAALIFMPNEHVADDTTLSQEILLEMALLERCSRIIMQKLVNVESVNCGYGIGPDAGISVKGHFHKQLVARPTKMGYGFLEMTGNTIVASYDPEKLYDNYKPEFDAIKVPRYVITEKEHTD